MLNPQALQLVQAISKLKEFSYQELSEFSQSDSFLNLFDTAFGTKTEQSITKKLLSQVASGDVSQFPQVEIVSSSSINGNGSYDNGSNKIYLSDRFLNQATTQTLISSLLSDYQHFVGADSHIPTAAAAPSSIPIDEKRTISPTKLIAPDAARTVTPLTGKQPQAIVAPSGDSRIDALLGGLKWGSGVLGTPVTLTYSFYNGGAYYGSEANLASVSEAVKTNVREILANAISPLINVNFVEVADSPTSYGQLRYLVSTDPSYAYAYYPYGTDANQGNSQDRAGDVFLNPAYDNASTTNGFQGGPGTHGYETLVHETLHAIGLKHPGDYNGDGGGDPPYLPYAQDNQDNTVMTYNFGGAAPATPMAYDLLALQYIYGAKALNASDTTYTFTWADLYSDGTKTVGSNTAFTKSTIWDTGGIDTLNFAALGAEAGYRFDLNEGGWLTTQAAFNGTSYQALSDPSGASYLTTTYGTRLAYGVSIENAIGTSSSDSFIGNSLDNTFTGGVGNDSLAGGGGNDIAIYTGNSDQYQILETGLGQYTITDATANRDGFDLLDSIEKIQFADKLIVLGETNITLTAAPASVLEDDTPNLVYTFKRTGDLTNALTVGFNISGTATYNTDYTQTGATFLDETLGSIDFVAGSDTAQLTIDPTTDTDIEADETVALTLNAGVGYNVDTPAAVITTIFNDDVVDPIIVTLTAAPASVLEDGTPHLVYTFKRTGYLTDALTVSFNISGTATFDTDYTLSGAGVLEGILGEINFIAGSDTAELTIDPTTDTDIEAGETVALTLTTDGSYTVGTPAAVTTTITNDDIAPLPSITLAAAPVSVLENGTPNIIYTFTRTGSLTSALTVGYGVGGTASFAATATSAIDYVQTGQTSFAAGVGTISFAAGSATATLTINPTGDTTVEANETVAVTLKPVAGYTLATPAAVTTTITNDDIAPLPSITLAAAPVSVLENGTPNIIYTFTRTGSLTSALTVGYGVGGTASFAATATSAIDYVQTGQTSFAAGVGTISFAAGSATATLTINPTGDTTVEANETVAVTLKPVAGYTLATPAAVTTTITNDDVAPLPSITLAATPVSVLENGVPNIVYTFTRTGSLTSALTVGYGVGGTASSTTDYTQTGQTSFAAGVGTIKFAAGSATATLTINPTGDTTVEANETVAVTLKPVAGYTLATPAAVTTTITNDDIAPLPSITLAAAPVSVLENGTPNIIYTFTRTGSLTSALTVGYGVGGTASFAATATSAIDYVQTGQTSFAAGVGTIKFAAGSATATLTINPTGDTTVEANETVAVTLKPVAGYTLATPAAVTTTITNDDIAPLPSITLAAAPVSVLENGTPNIIYTFTRTGSLTSALTVGYGVGGTASFAATATSAIDYVQTGQTSFAAGVGTIKFAAGSATAKLTINPTGDAVSEANETVALTLKTGAGYAVGTAAAVTTTILNDDCHFSSQPVNHLSVKNDLVLNVKTLNRTSSIGTGLQGKVEGEVIDLRSFAGQTFKVDTLALSDSSYNSYVGFYAVEDAQGTLANGLKVGDAGYAAAAIKSAVLRSSQNETQLDRTIAGGKILAPVAIVNGSFDDFLNRNPQNQANSDIHAYFNYTGANSDHVDHFQLLENNQFGLEATYGGGNRSYNDLVFQTKIKG